MQKKTICRYAAIIGGTAFVSPLLFVSPTPPKIDGQAPVVPFKTVAELRTAPILGVASAKAAPLVGAVQVVPTPVPTAAAPVVSAYPRREERVARMQPENKYEEAIFRWADHYGISRDLAWAQAHQESVGFNPYYVEGPGTSPAGARGLFQIMPGTAQGIARQLGIQNYSISMLWDPDMSARFGMFYMRQQLDAQNGNVERALRAYNAGPGAVDASYDYRETNGYVVAINAKQQRLYDIRVNVPSLDAIFTSGYKVSGYRWGEANHNDANGFWDNGLDIAPLDDADRTIHSPFEGTVEATYTVAENPVGGNAVVLRSPSERYRFYFGHLESVAVQPGQVVAFGDVLGVEGATGAASGPHIHLSTKISEDGVSYSNYVMETK